MNVKQIQAQFRAWVNNYSALVTAVSVLIVIATASVIVVQFHGEPTAKPITSAYYYNLNSGELFTGPIDAIPPVPVPDQPATSQDMGAMAYVFACRDCNDASDRYVGYVEVFNGEARDRLNSIVARRDELQLTAVQAVEHARLSTQEDPVVQTGRLIAKPDLKNHDKTIFMPANSEAGIQIIREAQEHCGAGRDAITCHPSQDGPLS